ncbi:hypothetical protein KIN20_036239 [Parelaphostrongylus tenuis]|uniref:Uncharacterized protein n=1 Tax=Parelaphostrongylus tenuis TaxID=148309 RepID=A0AAD5RCX2_PARTN|nr:hypothetical protein KIN20_036239 [Parelaphostrongylus tenuis]
MDESETRRGKLCWHKNVDVGLSAVNDAMLLDAFIDEILRELYAGHPQVDRLCACHQNSNRITHLGQLLDTISVREVDNFTWDRYEQLRPYGSPSRFCDISLTKLVFCSSLRMTTLMYSAIQSSLERLERDIQDGKCTWISVRAVQKLRAKPELDDFKANYGKGDSESVNNIRKLLHRLNIQEDFMNFEKKYCEKIRNDINQMPLELSALKPVLQTIISKLSGREK